MLVLVGLTLRRLLAPDPSPLIELGGPIMGTSWSVKVFVRDLPKEERSEQDRVRGAISVAIRERLARIESLMSTYDTESELSHFNRFSSIQPFTLSPSTFEVFALAQQVSELTAGAFDVTVAPMVAAWGFGYGFGQPPLSSPALPHSPNKAELEALRQRVGYQLLKLTPSTSQIAKLHPDVICDLSAVAKGYAVDQTAEVLWQLGYRDFLVEVGGELAARGHRADGKRWRVAIERPDPLLRGIYAVVVLEDQGMATSGDYRNFRQSDGVLLSHLIDPRLGRPIAHRLTSVSVVDPSTARADALATALSVLGPDEGFALAQREGIPAYFILRAPEGRTEVLATRAFGGLLEAEPGNEQAN